ncbi:hypothetical protein GpartN1_g2308.t1 [Galdieria partita]|uniref:Uncharacterized protein n=1 Tax=Galdieria partita TaxID=83374 RepID=A0A9C7PV57_9RHOD|nr:hypothetical protein GpartN1_g2308.t1 [Galdieria partita]
MHTSPRFPKGSLDYTLRFFHTLLTQDETARKHALDRILFQLENSLQGSDQGQLFVAHIATITRFASEVPFPDVREAFARLLERAETTLSEKSPVYSVLKEYQRLRKPVFSRFIPNEQLPTVQNANCVTLRLFTDNFLFTGRISTVVRVMAFFPSYLEAYIQSYRAIMRRPGPLPETWRNYLGVMAGARLRCSYICHMQETEFLLHGGDIRWLESDEHVPPKLLVLRELNAILAHQPWLLKKEHLQRLIHPISALGQVSWSLSECVLAILIFSHFHSLAGFIEGCGLCPDIDMDSRDSLIRIQLTREQNGFTEINANDSYNPSHESPDTLHTPQSEVEATRQLVEKLKRAIYLQDEANYSETGDLLFAKSASVDSNERAFIGTSTEALETKYTRIAGFADYPLRHEDFDVNSKTYKIFRIHEYNWSDHGYALINAFYEDGELASLLDTQFETIYQLTDNSIGMNTNVDTSIFRRAIWVYVHRLMGIMHDDYDYRLVNLILKQSLKAFIKKVACKPETISRNDYERMGLALRPEEKVHIVLLSMEARKQAELLYGLHAIMQWMNKDD